jgi:hypothetical protein
LYLYLKSNVSNNSILKKRSLKLGRKESGMTTNEKVGEKCGLIREGSKGMKRNTRAGSQNMKLNHVLIIGLVKN